jgi:hypothetical protein
MKKQFIKKLQKNLCEATGCSVQYNGWPCNTCFHNWAEVELGLSPTFGHLFWVVVLALRGDYKQVELEEGYEVFLEEEGYKK